MLTYDAQDLENRKKEAALQNDEAYYGYQNTMDKNSKDTSEYSRSSHDVEILEQQVENAKAEVRALKQYLTDMGCFLREAQNDNHKNLAEEYQAKIDQATNQLAVKEEELAEFQSDLSEQKGIKNSTESTMMTADAKKSGRSCQRAAGAEVCRGDRCGGTGQRWYQSRLCRYCDWCQTCGWQQRGKWRGTFYRQQYREGVCGCFV